jgi:hypothetical protein
MCKTTTPPHAAGQDAIRKKFPPQTTAGAVIPLKSYLQKYVTASAAALVPATLPVHNVISTHVAFSLWPLLANGTSPYYAGLFDDENHFSASLLKAAALFAAGQLHAEATAALPGFTFASFNSSLKAEINVTADQLILDKQIGLQPKTSAILNVTSTVAFTNLFEQHMRKMIIQSSDADAAECITALGYGYISTALKKENFFDSDTKTGIWLAAPFPGGSVQIGDVRIPCVNDHPDAQIATTRQMCRLFAMIRLKQLPQDDLDANTIMQNLLNEPKSGPKATGPWLSPDRIPGVAPQFSILQDKIGYAGLGSDETPNVYSEGLIIKWNDSSQVDSFNKKIDPTNTNAEIRLSGEIAVCWQNLLAEIIPGGTEAKPMFDPIIDVINDTLSDFLDQAPL